MNIFEILKEAQTVAESANAFHPGGKADREAFSIFFGPIYKPFWIGREGRGVVYFNKMPPDLRAALEILADYFQSEVEKFDGLSPGENWRRDCGFHFQVTSLAGDGRPQINGRLVVSYIQMAADTEEGRVVSGCPRAEISVHYTWSSRKGWQLYP